MTASMTLAAPAKVNLTLHITGRRADGFHLLESVIGFTDLSDRITLTPADEISLTVGGPESAALAEDTGNLVLRAAHLIRDQLRDHVKTASGAHIALEKNIPVAAGLGGGSADAAATMAGCLRFWNGGGAPLINDQTVAAELGADVPICRFGRAAKVSGIGEVISAVPPWPDAWLLLVNPRVTLSTAQVFKAFQGPLKEPEKEPEPEPETEKTLSPEWGPSFADFAAYLKGQDNSLTGAAMAAAPAIAGVLSALGALSGCALARMSGSGPTCFGLYATKAEANAGRTWMADNQPDWWVYVTPLLTAANPGNH
jgi:4-diphosphocytidyl-2-C-methyl-D-erythritol kinase